MSAYSKTRILAAGILVALTMTVVPAAFAADKPDAEHRYLGTTVAVASPTDAVDRASINASPDAISSAYVLPRAMPSDYYKAAASDVDARQGIPRAMPWHYAAAGVTLGQRSDVPRAMPADYVAAGVTDFAKPQPVAAEASRNIRDAVAPDVAPVVVGSAETGFDWSDAGLGAAGALALMVLMLVGWGVAGRRRSDPPSGVGVSVVQH